jgi:MoxR-like ATPase
LFGPLSLTALEKDLYIRNTTGYLPDVSVAFLDEIFKANSAILNSLLTILNERLFDNGNERNTIPLLALVAASNELPESEELDALYDRFLIRTIVKPISDNSVINLLNAGQVSFKKQMSTISITSPKAIINETIVQQILYDAAHVEVPMNIIGLLQDIRKFLRENITPPIPCSDRRLIKAMRLLCVSAASHGRNRVLPIDCLLLRHVFWQTPEDYEKIEEWLMKRFNSMDSQKGLHFLIENSVKTLVTKISSASRQQEDIERGLIDLDNFKNILINLAGEMKLSAKGCVDVEMDGKVHPSISSSFPNHLWIDIDSQYRIHTTDIDKSISHVNLLLRNILAMQSALEYDTADLDTKVLLAQNIGKLFDAPSYKDDEDEVNNNYDNENLNNTTKDNKRADKNRKFNKKRNRLDDDDN